MTIPYPTYRDSDIEWVGAIPATWSVTPMFAAVHTVKAKNTMLAETNLLSLSFGRIVRKDIDANEGLLPETFESYQIVERDDIVFRFTDLQNDKRSLRSALVGERGIITSAYLAITPRAHEPAYLAYLSRAYDAQKVFYAMGGGLRQSMKFDDVRRLPLLCPPLDEQRQIAEYLDRETGKIDELIAKQEQLVELLAERRQAVITEAVLRGLDSSAELKASGMDTIGSIPGHWTVAPLKHAISAIEQGVSPEASAELADSKSWGVLKSGCVNGGKFSDAEHKRLPDDFDFSPSLAVAVGDLLISRASGSPSLVGSAAIVKNLRYRLILSDKTFRLRPKVGVDVRFIEQFMQSKAYREQVRGAISGAVGLANNLPMSSLKCFQIAIPPLTEQVDIANLLDQKVGQIDFLATKAKEVILVLRERSAALISAAVTGKIDVSSQHPEGALA